MLRAGATPEEFAMVQIALATDSKYFQPTVVAMLSAIESTLAPVRVHFIGFGLGEQGRRIVARAVALHGHAELVYHEGTTEMLSGFNLDGYYTPVIMAPLHLPKLAQGKVLWLDSDVLVNADIADLFDIDIGDSLIGAARDMAGLNEISSGSAKGTEKMGRNGATMAPLPFQDFINVGVVLFNVDAMAAEPGFVEALASQVLRGNEQCTINHHCKGRVAFLDPSWNAMAGHHYKYASLEEAYLPPQARFAAAPASITHYVGPVKPWHNFDIDSIPQIGVETAPAHDQESCRAEFAKQVTAYRSAEARMLAMLQG